MVTRASDRSHPGWDPSPAAPEPLEQVRLFLNTLDLYRGHDRLGDVGGAVPALRSLGLRPRARMTRAQLSEVRELRRTLRARWVDDPGARSLRSFGLTLQIREDGADPRRVRLDGLGNVLCGGLAEMVVGLHVASGQLDRFKVCANPLCRWFFWDASRPGTGKWCSMRVCGGQHKSATYRRRHGGA